LEKSGSNDDIEVFCWATDDNPVMDLNTINNLFSHVDDQDELAMRRYGVFRQVSGRIYKSFDSKVHVHPFDKYFDPSLFQRYWHYRVIDYHPGKPWYVTWVAISPQNEWFVWQEHLAYHDHKTDFDIRDDVKSMSLLNEDEEFNRATLIDPLSKVRQQNTGYSVFDDISMGEHGLRRLTPADTKNQQGRMNIKMRLKNALQCGVPGNNLHKNEPDIRYGRYLPTIWFLDNCTGHIEHFRSWRYVDWKQENVKAVKVVKRESEKWSDYCRNLEFLGALNPVWYDKVKTDYRPWNLYNGRRAA
jgi:hypothetical protein